MRSVGIKIAGSFACGLLMLSIVGLLSFVSLRKMIEADDLVMHTHQVIEKLENVLSLVIDAETGQRGFVITGRAHYLEPYNAALGAIDKQLDGIRVLTQDNPRQVPRINQLTMLVDSKFVELRDTIQLRQGSGGFSAARAIIVTDRGKQDMDQIRLVIAKMESDERSQLEERDRKNDAQARVTLSVIAFGVPFTVLLLALLGLQLTRDIAGPLRQMATVAEQIAAGDLLAVTIPDRPRRDEIGQLLTSFGRMTDWLRRMSGVARRIAEGDLDVTVTPQSAQDQLGHAFALMIRNLRTITADLRRSEEWLKVTLASIGDAVITTDTLGCVTFLNPVAEVLTGWGRQDAVGQPVQRVFTIIHEQTRATADDIVTRVLREGAVVALANHTALVTRDGRTNPIEDSAAPIMDAAGQIIGVVVVFHDVTERRRTQEERDRLLVEVEQRVAELDATISSMAVGLIIYDSAGNAIRMNATANELFPPDIFLIHTLEERAEVARWTTPNGQPFPPEELPVARALRGETTHNVEIAFLLAGHTRCTSASAAPIRTLDGRMLGVVATFIDVTKSKLDEAELKTALREREVLLKEIHHRVKNNLQVISSLVSLQAGALDDPALLPMFNDLRDRVRSMALVHEKLYQSTSLAEIDFAEYTRSLLGGLWRAHGISTADIRLTLDVHPVALNVDLAVPCGLILNELVTNALKHAFRDRTDGEITVTLTTDQQGGVVLRVSDNGIGLPCELDWQQSPSLGLTLVQILTKQVNGALQVYCENGAIFELTLPPADLASQE